LDVLGFCLERYLEPCHPCLGTGRPPILRSVADYPIAGTPDQCRH
jgi:hypothetical protein